MRSCSLVLLVVLLVPSIARAQSSPELDDSIYSCKPRNTEVQITMKPEVELKELLAWAVGFTCKRFVFDPRIVSTGKKVTLIAPGKQSPAEAYDMFVTALATMGLTVVPKGKLLRIVDTQTGRSQAPPLVKQDVPGGEQLVRYVMRPTHAQPETLKQALSSFKSEAGDLTAIGALVVITDHGSHVRDMLSIAKLVDVPGGTDGIYTLPIRHADATRLAEKLGQLLVPAPAAGKQEVARDTLAPSKLLVDDRTNTLVIAGSEAAYLRVQALVERLDIALDIDGGPSMHVYQLGSAIAEELAKTLNDAIQSQPQGQGGAKPAAAGDKLGQLEGAVRVIADKPTNKLIVMSSGRDFLAMRDVIRQLDVPRRQLYIEATILEVQLGDGLRAGVSAHGTVPGSDGSVLVGGVQAPDLKSTSIASLASATGLVGGLVGKALPNSKALLGTSIPSYAVLFQALADTSSTNILSQMPIIVVDNEQAKYKMGTNVPYAKGVMPTSPDTATSSLTTNIDRRDLVLALDIKPHISTDDTILLEVKQSSEDLAGSDALGPSWSTRSLETRVIVKDQQTIVIGGLVEEREIRTTSKVPLLGDVPLLGYLFKYSTRTKKKMNLLVMLTPYIIKDHLDLEAIRARKQREHDEFAGSFRALDGARYSPRIDYRRKRGLVEEINRTVQDIEDEISARAALGTPVLVTPGLVEPAPAASP